MEAKLTKYFLYARKSEEDDERQSKSIEDQIFEAHEHLKKMGITITSIFTENKTAKTPGRKVFNEMIKQVIKSKEPIVIVAWHPDRLARNSVDGGQIIYLIDIGKIKNLIFSDFPFDTSPHGLFMLQIAFGQAKYFSDNLSANIKRGNRNKVKRGEWLYHAPLGYKRNHDTGNIEIVPEEAELVKQLFQYYSTGKYSYSDLARYLFHQGIKTRFEGVVKGEMIKCILTNPVYIGLIKYNDEIYEGKYDTFITPELFELVQSKAKRKTLPVKHINRHNFVFTGLFKCGECGGTISAQVAKRGAYRYYRCSKVQECSQLYIREEELISQIRDFLNIIQLPEGWYVSMLEQARIKEIGDNALKRKQETQMNQRLEETENRLASLTRHFLDQILNLQEYLKEKERLLKIKLHLHDKKNNFNKAEVRYVEHFRNLVSELLRAKELSSSNSFLEIKAYLKSITEVRILGDRKIHFELISPLNTIMKPQKFWSWSESNSSLKE